jgi:hypothetical protein
MMMMMMWDECHGLLDRFPPCWSQFPPYDREERWQATLEIAANATEVVLLGGSVG